MQPVRVLVIADDTAVQVDFQRILDHSIVGRDLTFSDAELDRPSVAPQRHFLVEACISGEMGLSASIAARSDGKPHGVAFVDLRMPGGLDGLATAEMLLANDPLLQIVLCTASADPTWATIRARLGANPADDDRVLVLKTSFDPIELRQLATVLGAKWRLAAERHHHHAELRARERMLQAVIDHAPVAVVLAERSGIVRLANRSFCHELGLSAEQAIGTDLVTLLPDALRQAAAERLVSVCDRGELAEDEHELHDRADPEHPRRLLLATFPLEDERGTRLLCAIASDVTKHREHEAQLRQSQKMEAIERLAGGVAHGFNNLLTAILGYAELLQLQLPSNDRLQGHAQEIYRSGQRAAALAKQLLAFSKRQVLSPQIVDLNHVIRDMERLLGRLIGEDIALEIRLDPALGTIKVDPSQLEQVVMNLVLNARDALNSQREAVPDRTPPRVILATARVRHDVHGLRPFVYQAPELAPGTYACLSVADNGPGLEPGIQAQIFEPFFSTKGKDGNERKGGGLGLATVYGIVQQSGGFIEVDSTPGRGSTFRVHLPISGEPTVVRTPSRVITHSPRGDETILLVEDQDEVRTLLEEILCAAGYTVLAAENPEVALGLAKQFGGLIHVMVTDMVMPNMDGGELRNRVLAINPGLKVIFMSGYADRELTSRIDGSGRPPFLRKPFQSDELLRTVRLVLEG